MARKTRVYCESQIYHVILRGNNKQNIFFDKNDRIRFIKKLSEYSKQLNIKVYSYCLMSNHVHILIGNANPTMSKLIQKLATSYAMFFNRKYEHSGHLFQDRYKSEPVESNEYFKTVTRYIIRNPEKANMGNFSQYKWNSYQQTINKSKSFICISDIFEIFDGKDNFIKFINSNNSDICMEYENKFFISDNQCLKIIKKILGIKSTLSIIEMSVEDQKNSISIIKKLGIPINQISRLTGIPRSMIKKS